MFASKDTLLTRPSGGYSIARSVRLRSSASAYFSRTFGTPTNNTTWTWSAWIKRGALDNVMLWAGASGNLSGIGITSNQIIFYGSAGSGVATSTAVFRDPSAWYHMVFVSNGTTIVAYVNNVQVLSYTGTLTQLNASGGQLLFCYRASSSFFDGYATEINFIDGQALTPSSFGTNNAITGVWQPAKYTGTYGTNGFYLNFSDNSGATATTIGKDYSGNGNNWTPNNISVTAGITYDSMTDVPTLTSATAANYSVLNPLNVQGVMALTNASLTTTITATGSYCGTRGTMAIPSTGKWYWETKATTLSGSIWVAAGMATIDPVLTTFAAGVTNVIYWANHQVTPANSIITNETTTVNQSATVALAAGDIVQCAYDADTGKFWFGKNNVYWDSSVGTTGNPSAGTNQTLTAATKTWFPMVQMIGNTTTAASQDINFGQRPFSYTPPTGYVALNTYNLPASTIKNGAAYMAATTYTGVTGGGSVVNTVNGVGFQPDFVWMKCRSVGRNHELADSVRGTPYALFSNVTNQEVSDTRVSAFNSNGFSYGTNSNSAVTGDTYVGWQWKAGGTAVSNTAGSITSSVSANTTAGFSVVTWTSQVSTPYTVGHGLGVVPSLIIVKFRSIVAGWNVYHQSLGATKYLTLQTTDAVTTSASRWNDTAPTSSVFTIGSSSSSTGTMVAYCFAAVAGYSAFGSYTGNGSTDGPFIYTGFRPRFVMIKRTDTTGDWRLLDTSRNTYNVANSNLYANDPIAEFSGDALDFVSNGFKLRATSAGINASAGTYIYAAFAENPFRNALAR